MSRNTVNVLMVAAGLLLIAIAISMTVGCSTSPKAFGMHDPERSRERNSRQNITTRTGPEPGPSLVRH